MLQWLFNGMARVSAFTVHEPPEPGGTRLERAERLLFVRDGFSWRVALLGPFYLLARGDWLALGAYVVLALVLSGAFTLVSAGNEWVSLMFVLLNVLMAFEANELKRWSLGRAGWREIGTVSGRGQEEAERRFFEAWLPSVPDQTGGIAGPTSFPDDDVTTRIEAAVRRLSDRLRTRFAIKT